MKTIRFNPVDPYNPSRFYGREQYNLQNMLLKQVNFPAEYFMGEDELFEVWSDRCYGQWEEAAKLIHSTGSGDSILASASDESLVAFAEKLFSLIEDKEVKLTGVAVIRHTNVSSGYPCLYVMGIKAVSKRGRKMGLPIKNAPITRLQMPDGSFVISQ